MVQQLPLLTIESIHEGIAGFNNCVAAGVPLPRLLRAGWIGTEVKAVDAGIHNLVATRKNSTLDDLSIRVSGSETGKIISNVRMGLPRPR